MKSTNNIARVGRPALLQRAAAILCGTLLTLATVLAEDKICFPPHEGLPWDSNPPTIDGYVEPELGVLTSEWESGWTRSGRVSYVGDTLQPLAVAQTIKHRSVNYIYLSFDVRKDESFDVNDKIVLVLRPNYFNADGETTPTTHTADSRRIDITPLFLGVGAGDATQPDDVPPVPSGAPSSSTYHIRTNRAPSNIEYYKWCTAVDISQGCNTANAWNNLGAGVISNADIKVRSWELGASQKNWSVEVRLPTQKLGVAGGGSSWINLATDFGLYFNVIRVCGTGLCASGSVPIQTFASNQFTWPRADYINPTSPASRLIQDPSTGAIPLVNHEIPAAWAGRAMIASAATDCRGVRFVDGPSSIGIGNPSTPLAGSLTSNIDAMSSNTFVARVVNDGTAAADGVRARYRIANWGIGGANATWAPIPRTADSSSGNGFSLRQTIPTGGSSTALTLDWQLTTAEKAPYCNPATTTCPSGALWSHQCMLVTLDSNQNVDFSEASVRRNMDFVGLSRFTDVAEISAKGYPKLPGSDTQDFLLRVSQIRIPSFRNIEPDGPGEDPSIGAAVRGTKATKPLVPKSQLDTIGYLRQRQSDEELSQWVWVMDAHRKTPATLTMGNTRYAVYEPVGAFGYFAEHKGPAAGLDSEVSGMPGTKLTNLGKDPNSFRVEIRNGEVAQLRTVLQTTTDMQGRCKDCKCFDVKCKMECDKQANSGSTMLASSLMLFGTVGVGGFTYIRRRKLLKRNNS